MLKCSILYGYHFNSLPMSLRSLFLFSLQIVIVALPAFLILYYALHAGGLADNDYWGEIGQVIVEPEGTLSRNLADWLQRSNEHYTLLPKLVYAANFVLTGGNNVGLSLFSWLMALLQIPLLYRLIPVKNKQHPFLFAALLLVIATLIFSPRQAHNWILGMSGVAWIMANFFSLSAIVAMQRYSAYGSRFYYYLIFAMSLCAVATYSTSLALFPTLMIAAFLYRLKCRDQLSIALFGLIILGLYYATYSTPTNHPAIQHSLIALGTYILVFIGGLFTLQVQYALIYGVLGIVSSVFMALYLYRKKNSWIVSIPWFSFQLYAGGNAAMAALARSGFRIEQALVSRYGSLSALFWLAWVMITITVSLQGKPKYRKFSLCLLLAISSGIIFNSYHVGLGVASPLLERAAKKPLSLASIYSHAIDTKLLNATGLPLLLYADLQAISLRLAAVKHIPFNGLFALCPEVGSMISPPQQRLTKQSLGSIDAIRLRNNQVIEVQGWAYHNGSAPRCLALTNQDNIVRGVAHYGLERLDVAKAIPEVMSSHTGWQGYGKVHKHDKIIKAYMLTAKGYWLPLLGQMQIIHQPLAKQKILFLHEAIR